MTSTPIRIRQMEEMEEFRCPGGALCVVQRIHTTQHNICLILVGFTLWSYTYIPEESQAV